MIDRDVLTRRLDVEGANVLVLGLAVTGRAAALALAAAGARVLASEVREDIAPDTIGQLEDAGVEVETGGHARAEKLLADVDLVVPSPGIPPRSGPLALALDRGVRVVSELDLAQRMTDAVLVGVTGTNGKTTVCRFGEKIAREAGLDAYACGNTEVPFIEAAVQHPNADIFIVECSSFRLYFSEAFHPRAAVITNLAPDHLDWHESMGDYTDAKARLAARQTHDDLFLYPDAQPELAGLAPDPGPQRFAFASHPLERGAWVEGDEIVVALGEERLRIPGVGALVRRGRHFAEDAAAAAAALVFCGAPPRSIERGLGSFVPDPHRLEWIGDLDGVNYYDDSIATNPHAAVTAMRCFDSVVLIAGGRKKVPDLSPLASESARVRALVVMGEAAEDVASVFEGTGVPVERVSNMADAVNAGRARAVRGDVVLLAPACASMDMYTNYAERGRDFVEVCRSLGVRM